MAYLYYLECDINWCFGLWTFLTVIIFHAAGNTWSDYFDFKKGVDRADNIGGISLTSGEFRPGEIIRFSFGLMGLAVAAGLILSIHTGLPTLYLGIAGFGLTLLYPYLKYNALGDVDIFITYGLLPILVTSYTATGEVFYSALWLSVPIGLITVAILHINNTRDIVSDKRAEIQTFAMIIGKKAATYIYCAEIFLPFIWIISLAICGILPLWSFIVVIALKPAYNAARKALCYSSEEKASIVGLDESTAQLQLIFSLLLVIACVIGRLV